MTPNKQQGRPTSPPTRKSAATVVTKAIQGTGEHRVTEALFALLGVTLLAGDGYFLFRHPPAGIADYVFHGVVGLIALGFIPGAASRATRVLKPVSNAVVDAWKKRSANGGGAS